MLVLSRKVRQAVLIGNDITVRVTEIKGNRVRLAFEAPKKVCIIRAELPHSDPPTSKSKRVA